MKRCFSNKIRLSYAEKFYHQIKSLTYCKPINLFLSQNLLKNVFNASAWLCKDKYIQDVFSEIVTRFSRENKEAIIDYVYGNISLNDLAKILIGYAIKKSILIDKEKVLNGLRYGDSICEGNLINYLKKNLSYKEHFNILGFGGASGDFEKKIASQVKGLGFTQKSAVYIFDPCYNRSGDDVVYIQDVDFIDMKMLKFDLISVRWVLHHIDESCRWKEVISCANQVSRNGIIFIFEEGSFTYNEAFAGERWYRYFLMCVDVVINLGLQPGWLFSSQLEANKRFYLNYLTADDLSSIKKSFLFNFKETFLPIGNKNFYSQVLIGYQQCA